MRVLKHFLAALALLLSGPLAAQATYPTAASGSPRVMGVVPLQCDTNAANCAAVTASNPFQVSATNTASAATVTSTSALAANLVVTSTASKRLASFQVSADSTLSAAEWYIMIYNATSAPADGAVTPVKCYRLPIGTTSFAAAFNDNAPSYSTGITIGVSTTGCFTKTASTHAFISGDFF